MTHPRSPGTHIVGSWDIDSISVYREPRTGTQYIGNWASRVMYPFIWGRTHPRSMQAASEESLSAATK